MISVIVPVYNVEEYLSDCVDSILKQTLMELELILVDDGSTDNSPGICDEYASKDTRVKVIHKTNGGSTSARNAGLLTAKGEYIGFVDSDDWIEPEMYEALQRCMLEYEADIVISSKFCSHEKSEYEEELPIEAGLYEGMRRREIFENLIYKADFTKRGITPNLYDKLFKRELLLNYQLGIDERTKYGEDDVCVYSCLINAQRIVVLNKAFYHYRIREGSVCHSSDDTYFERINLFYRQLKTEFEKHEEADILMKQLKRYMLEFVIRGINSYFGFGYGIVVPFYQPPLSDIVSRGVKKLVLYGAGQVGQDYEKSLRMTKVADVVAWVDRQYKDYEQKGISVCGIDNIKEMEYDAILIAVESRKLAMRISEDLVNFGIPKEKILYDTPEKYISGLRESV